MLSDWYFCCCLNTAPDQMANFLSILDVLEDPEADETLLISAYGELARAEVWYQGYAFPRVLSSLRSETQTERSRVEAAGYFGQLIGVLPEEMQQTFATLLNFTGVSDTRQYSQRERIDKILECERALSRPLPREISPVPYLDQLEFMPETILLAVLLDQLTREAGFASQLNEVQNKEGDVLERLVSRALDMQCGRLPFRLAARVIANLVSGDDRNELYSRFLHPSLATGFEPDVIQTFAEIYFIDPLIDISEDRRKRALHSIFEELEGFKTLRRLVNRDPGPEDHTSEALNRAGFALVTAQTVYLVPLIYWQSVLWELAAAFDPAGSAAYLVDHWRIPGDVPRGVEVHQPSQNRISGSWYSQLVSLLMLRYLKNDVTLLHVQTDGASWVSENDRWIFYSPWMRIAPDRRKSATGYVEGQREEALIRLCAAVPAAVRILQSLPQGAPEFDFLGSLLAHASNVLHPYRFWLRNYEKKEGEERALSLSLPVSGLVKYSQNKASLAGKGLLPSIDPASFVDILNRHFVSGAGNLPRKDATRFYNDTLPSVLISWITDAYTGAIEQGVGPARWLPLLPRVYQCFKEYHHNFLDNLEPACLVRFLSADYPLDYEFFDWRSAVRSVSNEQGVRIDQKRQWMLPSRQLLLSSPNLLPEDWLQASWDEPEDWDSEGYSPASRLVRALERAASLSRGGENDPRMQGWKTEWVNFLNAISEAKELDRFIRLRLLELLDDPTFQENPEGLVLIAHTILEFGSAYDLRNLFERVFGSQDTPAASSEVRSQLQASVLSAIYREWLYPTSSAAEFQDIHNPRVVYSQQQRAKLIEKALFIAAYKVYLSDGTGRMLQVLHDMQAATYPDPENNRLRKITGSIEVRGNRSSIILTPDQPPVGDWAVRVAAVNPNSMTADLFYEDLDLNPATYSVIQITNLFALSRREVEEIKRLPEASELSVLAIVVDRDRAGRDSYAYRLNCGFDFYLTYTSPSLELSLDQFVIVNLVMTAPGSNGALLRWEPVPMSVRPVKRNQRPSDCDWVTVREVVNRQTQLLDLFLRKDDQDLSYKEDPAWDANLSRIYREHPRNLDRPRRVQARLDQTGRWLPIDRNLIDLLIFLADRRWTYIKLAFINEVDDPNNRSDEKFYRFSFRPGENYLIPESQFTPEAIELLRETLQTYGDTQGLLVTLYPVAFNSSVCLALYEDADAQVYMFDDCNLRWKNIASSTWLAVRDRNRWYIPLEGEDAVPGFPDRIYVHWEDGTRPKDNVDQAEFDVTGWNEKDQRSQLVHGRSVYLNRVHPDGNNFELFYNRLNNLQTGHVLCLGTQKSKPTLYPDGTFSYRTTELLPVRVDLESASMLPILADELIPLVTNRMAEVRSFRWNPVTEPPLFDTYQLPQELLDQKEITGFFTEVPRLDQEASLCKVLFPLGNEIRLQIDNLRTMKVNTGCKLYGYKDDQGEWRFEVQQPSIFVRALWEINEVPEPEPNFYFLGQVTRGEQRWMLYETPAESGVLQIVRAESWMSVPPHLAHWDGSVYSSRWRLDARLSNAARSGNWREADRVEYTRAVINLQNHLLGGKVRSTDPRSDFHILNANFHLFNNRAEPMLYSVQRTFVVTPIRFSPPAPKPSQTEADQTPIWKKDFLEKFNQNQDLEVIMQADRVLFPRLKVPADDTFRSWGSHLPIAPGEGSFLSRPAYPTNSAIVRLMQDSEGRYQVSLRRVPAYDPNEFMQMVNGTYGETRRLDFGLYYVGRETVDRVTLNPYEDGPRHRFEWGYGKTLLVPESRLRYDDQPFDKAKFILFYGDEVVGVTFFEEKVFTPAMEELSQCVINITQANVTFSGARSLYMQRRKHQILHFLKLTLIDGEVAIADVEGFDETKMLSSKRSFFSRIQSSLLLKETDRKRMAERFKALRAQELEAESEEPLPNEIYILARLDEQAFVASFGHDLLFEHVRMNFRAEPDAPADGPSLLRNRERLLMQAGTIQKMQNDTGLYLLPHDKLDPQDIGKDFNDPILLLRKHFSVREDLLRNILLSGGEAALEGSIFLVRLDTKTDLNKTEASEEPQPEAPGKGKPRSEKFVIYSSIRDGMPSRSITALATAVDQAKSALLAVVASFNHNTLNLEVKPGVYLSLSPDDIQFVTPNLLRGDVVAIRRSGGRFIVVRVAFSDSRYVPEAGTRGAVALPKNDLLDNRRVWNRTELGQGITWFENNFFTIGNLPDVSAGFGEYHPDRGTWTKADLQRIEFLMERRHPKLVSLGRGANRFFIDLPADDIFAGRLKVDEGQYALTIVSMLPNQVSQPLEWPQATFSDLPAREVFRRALKETWFYHDEITGYWAPGQKRAMQETVPAENNLYTGPLFFEMDRDNRPRLRYTPENFLKFGYPVDELITALSNQGQEERAYAVAGVEPGQSLWIELCPGRIIEIPLELMRWELEVGEVSLMDVHCPAFAPGDRLHLRLGNSEGSLVNQIILTDWISGPRGAFGPRTAFLPVFGEKGGGGLTLGAGEYRLTLPVGQFDNDCTLVALTPDNQLFPDPSFRPVSGDVVLLIVDEGGRVRVAGFPDLQPRAAAWCEETWAKDDLADLIVRQSATNRLELNFSNLSKLIQLAGGSLPVTVERVTPSFDAIYISRRCQIEAGILPPGKMIPTRLLGITPDGYSVLLRSGSGILCVPIEQVISGLPVAAVELAQKAVDFLKKENHRVWVRKTSENKYVTGVQDEPRIELSVRMLGWAAEDRKAGIICRATDSRKFYWLPANRIGWTMLNTEELDEYMRLQRGNVVVRLMPKQRHTPYVSLVDTNEISRAFKGLEIGSTLSVLRLFERIQPEQGQTRAYLVESSSSHILMECEIYDGSVMGENEPVEVVKKVCSFPYVVQVVPYGKRRYTLDLPGWLTNELPEPGLQRERFANYLSWRASPSIDLPIDCPMDDLIDEEVEKYLCYAFDHPNEKLDDIGFTLNIADQWHTRNQHKTEVDLHYQLMTTYIFYRGSEMKPEWLARESGLELEEARSFISDWRRKAAASLQDLGRRAIRSLHAEVLTTNWAANAMNRNRSDGLWVRLNQLIPSISNPAALEDIETIRRFCQVARLRGQEDMQAISDCLVLATGGEASWAYVADHAEIMMTLLQLYAGFLPTDSAPSVRMLPGQIDQLAALLNRITLQQLDITLLAPLPRVEVRRDEEEDN